MKKILPPTTQRVAHHTCYKTNAKIREQILQCLEKHKDSSQPLLSQKIEKLNCEWDTERFLETNAASILFLSSIIGFKKSRNCWFLATGTISMLLLLHALQGWCPPLPLIRKIGVRTPEEIRNEKDVLKRMRGDFSQNTNDANEMLATEEKQ